MIYCLIIYFYILKEWYILVTIVFLPQEGESTKGAPTLVGGKTTLQLQVFGYKSPKLGEYAHFFTSTYIKQIKYSHFSSTKLRISQIGGGNAQKVFGWICMHLPKEQDRHTRTKFWFSDSNCNLRQICSVGHNLFALYFCIAIQRFCWCTRKMSTL